MARRVRTVISGGDPDNSNEKLTRRRFLGSAAIAAAELIAIQPLARSQTADGTTPAAAAQSAQSYWWYRCPSFAQMDDPDTFRRTAARMVIHGNAKDPTWGPFGQMTSQIEDKASLEAIKKQGGRAITWIEGFGDCMIYAAAFNQNPDGAFQSRTEAGASDLALVVRSHWNWADPKAARGNALRWVGIHNLVDDEDFARPLNHRLGLLKQPPTYPDGTPALGTLPGRTYPLNHKVYDACGSKDLNGYNYPNPEAPNNVNATNPDTGKPNGPIEGLYPAIVGKDDVAAPAGSKPGDTIYCGVISIHKDLSAPFWRQYVRRSIKQIVAAGLDGVWCDNYSPWDNFGYPPIQKAFGDWSVAKFRQYLPHEPVDGGQTAKPTTPLDVRAYLKRRATEFGAKDSSDLTDKAWHDSRWLLDPVWCAYKACRQINARKDLNEFYTAIHAEATAGGRPDFCIGGNDVPMYGLGWVRDTWQDMINTETTPGWHMGTGSRGIMIPPIGKMAIMYRAALEHQKGPFSAAWYYLNSGYEKFQQKPELGKTLCCEAFAHGAFLLCMPDNKQVCGTVESHAWWNQFVREHEDAYNGRIPVAQVGVLFSPDNQLLQLAPGGYPSIDEQPHIFAHHGWATACLDAHFPFRTITDWKLTPAVLEGLTTLVLPHAEALSDAAVRNVVQWTRGGGRLILTGAVSSRREPEGNFAPRRRNQLSALLGVALPKTGEPRTEVAIGKGKVIWYLENHGSEYYLKQAERADLLPELERALGPNGLVSGTNLPSTVSVSVWRSADQKRLFVDLVNYNIDPDQDIVTPASDLEFKLKLPANWNLQGSTAVISPDPDTHGTGVMDHETATIHVPHLHHFATVVLSN